MSASIFQARHLALGCWVLFGVDQNEHEATTVGGSFLTHIIIQLVDRRSIATSLRACCFRMADGRIYTVYLQLLLLHTVTTHNNKTIINKINHQSMNESSILRLRSQITTYKYYHTPAYHQHTTRYRYQKALKKVVEKNQKIAGIQRHNIIVINK